MEIRNIAVIAHVDHGKTTLVDRMIESGEYDSSQKKMTGDLIMDNNDLEKERGITIVSKNVSVKYKNTKINIFNEMTNEEKELIKTSTFDQLWEYLWGDDQIGIQYRGEEKISRDKFNLLKQGIEFNNKVYDLDVILENCKNEWDEQE